MITLIAGVDRSATPTLTDLGMQAINRLLERAMTKRWPDIAWYVVPGGEQSDEWKLLIAQTDFLPPAAEHVAYAVAALKSISHVELPPGSWEDEVDH